jgi:hypothetical protein
LVADVLCGRRVPEDCTYEEKQLVHDCLQVEPDERPSAKDLVNRLAGSSSMARTISTRSSSLSVSGHISGQQLADRCSPTPFSDLPSFFQDVS